MADGVATSPPSVFSNEAGLGVEATVDGSALRVGRASFVGTVPNDLEAVATTAADRGHTAVFVGIDGAAVAVYVVADATKPSSARAIAALHDLDVETVMVTGDREATARTIADEVGIDRVHQRSPPRGQSRGGGLPPGRRPPGRGDRRRRQRRARLAQADLGIAIGTGADVAIEASDLTLVSGDLRGAPDAIALSRATLRTIKGNLFWAFAYNVAAIPLAAFGLLNPIIAAGAMGFSSVFVVTNSLRLRRFRGAR